MARPPSTLRSRGALARGALASAIALAAFLALVPEASAQWLHGRLVDETNRQPIQGAMIQLFDEEGDLVAFARTDAEGNYQVAAPGPGRYRFTVTSVGYGSAGSDYINLAPGQSLRADLMMPPAPIVIEGITAEVEARPWMVEQPAHLWPYFERREFYGKLGLGRFVDREFLENWSGPIESIPEVDLLFRTMGQRTGAFLGQGCSQPAWYLDGNRVRDININDLVGVWELQGVEVYRRATEIPGEFGGADSECGVVALWTRRR